MIEAQKHEAAIDRCKELAAVVDRYTDGSGTGAHATAIDPLVFMRECDPFTAMHVVSEPLLAIVVQGKKEVMLNEETYQYGIAQYLVVSVDLPLSGCVVEGLCRKNCLRTNDRQRLHALKH